ncbi:G-protein coupled receptor 54-like [Glandiceps talaboti]
MSDWDDYSDYNYSDYYLDYDYKLGPESIIVPTLWGIFAFFGLVGNIFVIVVVFKFSHMRTVTNYYIVNLALTDVVVLLICVPSTSSVFALHTEWVLGDAMCRIVIWLQLASWQASCLTLTVISVDRYHAIVYPVKSIKYRTPRAAIAVNVSIWIYSYLVTTPVLYFYRVEIYPFDPDHSFCIEYYEPFAKIHINDIYATLYTIHSYAIPLIIVFVCYSLMVRRLWLTSGPTEDAVMSAQASKQKKKITRMVFVVVLLYMICHLPNQILNMLFRWNRAIFYDRENAETFKALRILSYSLLYFNSIINPIVYNVLGDNFRKSLKKAFFHHFRSTKVRDSNTMNTVNGNGTHTMNISHTNRVHPSSSQSRSDPVTYK